MSGVKGLRWQPAKHHYIYSTGCAAWQAARGSQILILGKQTRLVSVWLIACSHTGSLLSAWMARFVVRVWKHCERRC